MSEVERALQEGQESAGTVQDAPDPSGGQWADLPGVIRAFGELPAGTLITEDGLAAMLGKVCRETVKRAVERGELPRPVRLMGRNTWTVGAIVRHLEARLEAEARKFTKLRT